MDKLQALHQFWSGFGWKAYNSASVPDNAELPYITYEGAISDFDRPVAQTAQLNYRATGWTALYAKQKEIADAITRGGKIIRYDGGALHIRKEMPWGQEDNDPDDLDVKKMYLNYSVEYYD